MGYLIGLMLTIKNIIKGLRDPKLLSVWLRRHLLFGAVFRDNECIHMVRAWSSGKLPRVVLRDVFPGIEACSGVSVRKPESRTIGWSLDLQELIHILSVAK